ncbi:MAG: glycoside hydrolase family 78 protein [Spirochaetaceae bacterium]|jgi:alpha-L-rhamnosidase|nr:glycoside hydrolase family 78 protein [Spirochaetaceae bacterium]
MIKAVNLKTEGMINPVGIDTVAPRLSWTCESAIAQSAYHARAVNRYGKAVFDSGKVASVSMSCIYRGNLQSRDRITWTVTLWDENDSQGESTSAFFERGLTKTDWKAKWINPESEINPAERQRASYLRKTFTVADTENARLYITAHGIYNVYLNGKEIEGFLYAPGTSEYNKRLAVQTYDVSALLNRGENTMIVTLGDGWYRGSVGNRMHTNTFGTDISLLCQLEVNGAVVLASGGDWEASQDGPLGLNDHMMGEEFDARKEPVTGWHPVTLATFGFDNLIGQNSVPVTAHERFNANVFTAPNGDTVLDFGQNVAGFVEFDLEAQAGQTILLQHGETLDKDGNFTVENFQNPSGARRDQVIRYVCKDGRNTYHATKCFFGFRYVKVETDITITGKEFTGVAVYSAMPQTGFFTCGDERVNQLFRNALWSMKSNFLDVPTDCPTREKSGFSGDCQVFVDSAMYLMDCYPVYRKWLAEQQATQDDQGLVKMIAPGRGGEQHANEGSAGWSDSIEIIPYKVWLRYNDDTAIRENYEALTKWMRYCLRRAGKPKRAENETLPDELKPYYSDAGTHWGEWLEPGMDMAQYTMHINLHGEPEVATAYLAYGCHLASEMAKQLGNDGDAAFFADTAEKAKNAYRYVFVKEGFIDSPRQCRYVRPIALDLLSEPEKRENAARLAEIIKANGYKLNTGFLTTAELCRVLTDYGQADTAYRLLLQKDCPGWLHPISKGATSIWERWEGINENGDVTDSFNHYAYGAVVGWLFDRVCGIRLYKGHITIQPIPNILLGSASAVYHSPFGVIESGWKYEADTIRFTVKIPCNARARVMLPDGTDREVGAGSYEFTSCISVCRETHF